MNYKSVIESRYNRQSWLEMLRDIFGSKADFYANPATVTGVNTSIAKGVILLGFINLTDGEKIAIYEVELTDQVIIERNRVGIRNLLIPDWRGLACMGAIMLCYNSHESVVRFSYVCESYRFDADGNYVKESTDPKRFTYYLGEGHRSRTAIEQFEQLKKSKLTLSDLTRAFSVEAVSKRFFDDYRLRYEKLCQYVIDNLRDESKFGSYFADCYDAEPEGQKGKQIRDYVKKMMGRLTFLHFVQRKGWLCNDPNFMQNAFENKFKRYQDSYLDKFLEPLFFGILNTAQNSRKQVFAKHKDWDEALLMELDDVPYLGGGLFENDSIDSPASVFPKEYFADLFDFYASYNFTIDENDPNDAEVGVDPEMLGRIFENLLEDNKDKGAFYTPKEIVQYMCRESLIAYLQTDAKDDAHKERLRQFVTKHDCSVLQDAEYVRKKIKEVKICDPAIGSGAFPMGLLNELTACTVELNKACGKDESRADIKKHIIQNSIYGVDIERGAVDIARLRFWLSIVVDETEPLALPNLDFKIMQGNSLLEQYEGVDLSDIDYKKTKRDKKKGIEVSLFDNEADVYRKFITQSKDEYFTCTNNERKIELRNQIKDNAQKLLKALQYEVDLNDIDIMANDKFFLWHTWFGDVFDKGGFDIVIGNPPYIQLQGDGGKLGEMYGKCSFETYARTGDIYSLFYERGWQMLKNKGTLSFITSNKWMRAGYGEATRKFFAEKTNPQLLIDFAGVKVFETATVDVNILQFAKARNVGQTKCVMMKGEGRDSLSNLSLLVEQKSCKMIFANSDSWVILSPIELSIKNKIESVGTPLKDWNIQINYGIKTGFNDAFIISTEKRNELLSKCRTEEERQKTAELIRPILRGRDIKRYGYDWADLWLINTHNGVKGKLPRINIDEYPSVKEHLDKYWEKISTRADKGETPYNLRNCAYMEDFSKPKIMYPNMTKYIPFYYDEKGFYQNDKSFMITGEHTAYLTAFLNSSLFKFCFLDNFPELQGGTRELRKIFFDKIPVLQVNDEVDLSFRDALFDIQNEYTKSKAILIDEMIFDLYDLSDKERKTIGFVEI